MVDPEISTKEHAGEFDCLETAKPGEPLFILQGGDPHSPATIRFWVGLARASALKFRSAKKREAMLRRCTSAENVAWKMEEYQAGDMPEPEKTPSTVAVVMTAEDDQRAARIKAVARIHNMIGEGTEIYEGLKRYSFYPDQLLAAIDILKNVAVITEPRSDRERT
jgi:hypothetical protein